MKKEFRKKVIELRKQENLDIVEKSSNLIFENLLTIPEINNAQTIMAYLDFNNEAKTDKIINHLPIPR